MFSVSLCAKHIFEMQNKQTREKDLEAILIICIGLLAVYFFTKQQHLWLIVTSAALGFIGVASSWFTSKIVWLWMQIGEKMGWVMSKVILGTIFFLFLLPLALISRATSKASSLQLKKPAGDSYYFTRNHKYEPKDLKNVW